MSNLGSKMAEIDQKFTTTKKGKKCNFAHIFMPRVHILISKKKSKINWPISMSIFTKVLNIIFIPPMVVEKNIIL